MKHRRTPVALKACGFTLIEVLVALVILALMAAMAWQSIASMFDTRERLRDRSQALLGLQTGLAQWQTDLRAHTQDNITLGIVFDGQSLRFTRRDAVHSSKLRVVAWAIVQNTLQRYESAAMTEPAAIRQAWRNAQMWAQTGNSHLASDGSVHKISPVSGWALAYFYADGWTNAQSSAQRNAATSSNNANAACEIGLYCNGASIPEQALAVRMTLTIPAQDHQPWSGKLTMQWLRTGASLSK